jgi:hypothetical protein
MLLGSGPAEIAVSGLALFHWYITDELWILSKHDGGHYAAYSNSPIAVVYYLGFYGIVFAFGVLSITAAFYTMVRYWARLAQRDRPATD